MYKVLVLSKSVGEYFTVYTTLIYLKNIASHFPSAQLCHTLAHLLISFHATD